MPVPGMMYSCRSRSLKELGLIGFIATVAKSCLTLLPPHGLQSTRILSMLFLRQEYWSRLPFPPPRDLPDPGIKPRSPALAGRFFTTEPPGKPRCLAIHTKMLVLEIQTYIADINCVL